MHTDSGKQHVKCFFEKISSRHKKELACDDFLSVFSLVKREFEDEFNIELQEEMLSSLIYDYFINNSKRRDIRFVRDTILTSNENIEKILIEYKLKNHERYYVVYESFRAQKYKYSCGKDIREFLVRNMYDENFMNKIVTGSICDKILNILVANDYLKQVNDNYFMPSCKMLAVLMRIKKNIFVVYPLEFYLFFK